MTSTTGIKPAYDVTFKGMRVPWITRWSDEVVADPIACSRVVATNRAFMHYSDGNEDRDRHGVLWAREGVTRGGTPQFSQVSVYRQRQAMRHRLCQVCGRKITDRIIHWLMPTSVWEAHPQTGEFLSTSAPTCEECIPVALALCPHLKARDWKMLHVLDYELWGVSGEGIFFDKDHERHRARGIRFGYPERMVYSQFDIHSVVAKQQLVVFTKFKEVAV